MTLFAPHNLHAFVRANSSARHVYPRFLKIRELVIENSRFKLCPLLHTHVMSLNIERTDIRTHIFAFRCFTSINADSFRGDNRFEAACSTANLFDDFFCESHVVISRLFSALFFLRGNNNWDNSFRDKSRIKGRRPGLARDFTRAYYSQLFI